METLIKETKAKTGVHEYWKETKSDEEEQEEAEEIALLEAENEPAFDEKKELAPKPVPYRPKIYKKKKLNYSGVASLKGVKRSRQKAYAKYGKKLLNTGKWVPRYNRILDVVRGTLTFEDFDSLIKGMNTVLQQETPLGFKVVRCKQTYLPLESSLYGDIKMNLQDSETLHICELQFTVRALFEAKTKGHKPYEANRSADPLGMGLIALNEKSLDNQDDIALIKQKSIVQQAIHGSHAAYSDALKSMQQDENFQAAIDQAEKIKKWIDQRNEKKV